jgi:hypothetical protein
VLFRISDQFNPNDPDFDYVHQVVRKALAAPAHRRRHRATSPAQDDADACAYHPGQSY